MKSLDPIDRNHENLYLSCVGQTQNEEIRNLLINMTGRVVANGIAYEDSVRIGRSDLVTQMAMTDDERFEISKVYDSRLVSKSGVERPTYDKVRTLTGKCPFCGFGEVYEVDHYLPKNAFPELNVLPKNLLPICHPCNHIKHSGLPEGPDSNLIHPYFDNLPNERWLFADLTIENGGPVLHYYVQLDARFGILCQRLEYHFAKLQLSRRMKEQSARVLVEMEADIDQHLADIGTVGMSQHFREAGQHSLQLHGNVIETAAFFSASENEQYCAGAFKS